MKYHTSGWWVPDFYPSGPGTYLGRSKVIDYALGLVKIQHRTVIQAGGHIGVWPKRLSQSFERVISFEPVPSNWECLAKNVENTNIEIHCSAIGSKSGLAQINHRVTSSGGHHIATRLDRPYIDVELVKLDDVVACTVDAMFLDIEGYEIEALKGATRILESDHPLLVLENNGCSKKFGYGAEALEQYLLPYRYVQVGVCGEDIVFHAN